MPDETGLGDGRKGACQLMPNCEEDTAMRRSATIGLAAALVVLTHVPAAAKDAGPVGTDDMCEVAGCKVTGGGDDKWCCCPKSGGQDWDCDVLERSVRPTIRVPGMQSNPKVRRRPRRPSTVR